MNILIIDDNENLAQQVNERFKQLGNYDINTVHDGAEALDILRQRKFDIIILDVVLPKVSGISLLEEIRSEYNQNNKSFIIVTSSITHPSLVENANKLGADFFITKPYKVESLTDAVEVYKQIQNLEFMPCLDKSCTTNFYGSTTKDMYHDFTNTSDNKSSNKKLDEFCNKYLKDYEISEKFKGYDLIVKAFAYLLENENSDDFLVTKDIYPYLAKLTHSEISSVERNIRNAIKCAKIKENEPKLTNLTFLLKMKKTYITSTLDLK